MGNFQPGAGGLGHPWATYVSPKLFLLLACLNFTTRATRPVHFALAILEIGSCELFALGVLKP
jgi:hypothetical protein